MRLKIGFNIFLILRPAVCLSLSVDGDVLRRSEFVYETSRQRSIGFKAERSLVWAVGVRSRCFDPPDSQRRDVFSRVRRQVCHKSHRPINSVTTLVVRLPDEPSERICPLPSHHPQHTGVVRWVYPVHERAGVYLFIRSDPCENE